MSDVPYLLFGFAFLGFIFWIVFQMGSDIVNADKIKAEKDAKIKRIHDKRSVEYRSDSRIFEQEFRARVLKWTDGRCFHCGENLLSDGSEPWQIDHLWPRRYGGVHESFNLVASCTPCNTSKSAMNPFYHIYTKWSSGEEISSYERKFLEYYAKNSPARLTTNPTWQNTIEKWPELIGEFNQALTSDAAGNLSKKDKDKLQRRLLHTFSMYSTSN